MNAVNGDKMRGERVARRPAMYLSLGAICNRVGGEEVRRANGARGVLCNGRRVTLVIVTSWIAV